MQTMESSLLQNKTALKIKDTDIDNYEGSPFHDDNKNDSQRDNDYVDDSDDDDDDDNNNNNTTNNSKISYSFQIHPFQQLCIH